MKTVQRLSDIKGEVVPKAPVPANPVVAALDKQTRSLLIALDKAAPAIDNSATTTALEMLAAAINNRPTSYAHVFKRDAQGNITSITTTTQGA